jgi:hypothetical protein
MIYKGREKEYKKEYREKNKEKIKEQNKQYQLKNKEKLALYDKQYYLKNKEKIKEKKALYDKQYYLKNKEKMKENVKQYRLQNKEKIKEKHKQYYLENKEKIQQYRLQNKEKIKEKTALYHKQYNKNKWRVDQKFNLNHRMSVTIGISLKGNKNGRHWEMLVGYSLNDLKKHLKSTMPKGYTWQDFMQGKLHIDHIIPVSVWNFTKPEHVDFKRCWALDNLQLLPASENIVKSNKLYKPFQPALKI